MAKKHSSSNTEKISTNLKTILSKLVIIESLLERSRDKPLTFREACAYLGYAPSYLYKLTYKKLIPHYKPTGKMIFFSKSELDEWIYKSSDKLRVKSDELKQENANEKDPHQVDMFDASTGLSASNSTAPSPDKSGSGHGSKQEKEIVIEFPLKSRRRKEL